MLAIDLSELTHGEVRNLSGHDRGVAARAKFNLAAADASGEKVEVKIPESVYAIAPSFFQGLFAESVHSAGSREKFYERFRFNASIEVLRQIDGEVSSSLVRRRSIFAA